jgi:hypothetical protein
VGAIPIRQLAFQPVGGREALERKKVRLVPVIYERATGRVRFPDD